MRTFVAAFIYLALLANPQSSVKSVTDTIIQYDSAVQEVVIETGDVSVNSFDTSSLSSKSDEHESEKRFRCEIDCGMLIQLGALLIAIITLIISLIQAKKSSDQAKLSYDTFTQSSEKQFNIQTDTLNTIKNQTDKIYISNKKKEVVANTSQCYTLMKTICKYLKDHFADIIRNTDEKFLFDLLQPLIKSAVELDITITSETGYDKEFVNAVKACSRLDEKNITQRKDVEQLIEELESYIGLFEKQLNQINR